MSRRWPHQGSRGPRFQRHASGTIVNLNRPPAKVPELCIIVAGTASMTVRTPDGRVHELHELEHGDFFGEATLLSGADSPCWVGAVTDVEALAPGDVHRIVESKPSFAMAIGRIMDVRCKAVQAAGAR